MNQQIFERLERIAGLIDHEHIRKVEDLQDKIWALKPVDRIPVIRLGVMPPEHPLYPYDETFQDPDKMFWNELLLTYVGVLLCDDRIYTLRANYGPAIIPSMFGAKVFADANTTWIEGLHDTPKIRKLIDKGIPDINSNLGAKSFETQSLFQSYLEKFNLDKYIHLVQTDTQGPFDIAELIWGAEIYYAMHDEPDLVHSLLGLITETIIAFIKLQKKNIHEPVNQMYHWWYKIPAGARIVDDISITLSPAMYEEFVKPYNEKVFNAFEYGYMHYCGHGLQNQHLRLHTEGLRGIEMGGANIAQNIGEFNLESIWRQAYEHNVAILWVGPGLPAKRPDIPSGLIYLCSDENIPYEQEESYFKQIKEFWS